MLHVELCNLHHIQQHILLWSKIQHSLNPQPLSNESKGWRKHFYQSVGEKSNLLAHNRKYLRIIYHQKYLPPILVSGEMYPKHRHNNNFPIKQVMECYFYMFILPSLKAETAKQSYSIGEFSRCYSIRGSPGTLRLAPGGHHQSPADHCL